MYNIIMELQLITTIQYKIIQMIGKKVVLPMFMNNISDISITLLSLKNNPSETCIKLKQDLDDTDLEHKIMAIGTFLKEITEDEYNSNAIHIHLCGIYDVLDNIKIELKKINEEYEYMKISWYYYTIGWLYYKSQINIHNVKRQVKLLDDRYDMLLKMLMVHKS
jgi:hypothetical protein